MKSLIWVGSNIGWDVDEAVERYDSVKLFEPLPMIADALRKQFADTPHVEIIEAACWTMRGNKVFRVYNTVNGSSSSLGIMTAEAIAAYPQYDLGLIETIVVECVWLPDYMPDELDALMIDAQGADLTILKTIEPWLQRGGIGEITVEADGEGFRHYDGLGSNAEEDLVAYMEQFNYSGERVAGRVRHNPDWKWVRNG